MSTDEKLPPPNKNGVVIIPGTPEHKRMRANASIEKFWHPVKSEGLDSSMCGIESAETEEMARLVDKITTEELAAGPLTFNSLKGRCFANGPVPEFNLKGWFDPVTDPTPPAVKSFSVTGRNLTGTNKMTNEYMDVMLGKRETPRPAPPGWFDPKPGEFFTMVWTETADRSYTNAVFRCLSRNATLIVAEFVFNAPYYAKDKPTKLLQIRDIKCYPVPPDMAALLVPREQRRTEDLLKESAKADPEGTGTEEAKLNAFMRKHNAFVHYANSGTIPACQLVSGGEGPRRLLSKRNTFFSCERYAIESAIEQEKNGIGPTEWPEK